MARFGLCRFVLFAWFSWERFGFLFCKPSQLGSSMLLLVTLATCGIVPWDLTTFLVCDFLLTATIVVGAIRRCRRPGKSPGEQSASPQEPPKQPSTPTHGENAKKEPQGELGSYSWGSKHGLTLQQYRWEHHLSFIREQEEQRTGPRRRNSSVHDTPKRRPNPPPTRVGRAGAAPPPLGRREENRCQERARAAGRIILDGLQEVPEERLEKNRPLDTSQWMSA